MRFIVLGLALFCAVAYAAAQELEYEDVPEFYIPSRSRREADPQGSIVVRGQKPLSGPDRRPSLDVDYSHRVFDRNGATGNAYGGLNIRPGQPPQPHLGFQAERNFNNGAFIKGFGQVQRGPGGGPSPSFGIGTGMRWRRDVEEVEKEEEASTRPKREADPQGSIVVHGQKPLSGPDRRPSLDVDYSHRVFDRNGATGNAYGGLNIRPGQPPQPHLGFQAERNFNNGAFIKGFGQVQRGPGGGPSPSFGIGTGMRWRRDVEEVEEEEEEALSRPKREADPQGSIVVHGQKPLSGPDRRPSLDVDYSHRVFDRNGATGNAYGGLNIRPGQPPQPHLGFQAERNFNNGAFIKGFGQVQRGPGGGPSPSFGIGTGMRWRRDVEEVEEEEEEALSRSKREDDRRGSVTIHAEKPMSGPDRRPSYDVDFNRRVFDREGLTGDVFGGFQKRPDQRFEPHVGIQAERNFRNGAFIRGFGQVERGRGGNPSPSFGIGTGMRWRRDVEEVEEEEEEALSRSKREDDRRGSVTIHAEKPMSGPDRRPSYDVDFNRRVFDREGLTGDVFGGFQKRPDQRFEPHVGIQAERNFRNGAFIRGFGQVERGRGGNPSPSFGIGTGMRW
ncbi:uncharacterized protein LOC143152957 [Ptiloglossa arizonensis]|uniref:uncharacterized protein LOC143152957 n=1 Tax=Ptiloglossa arizonensis TaxID=3350558 RepID=UPI003FA16241